MTRTRCFLRFLCLALPLLLMAESAFAWVGVGPDASCEVRTIQAAIDRIIARESHGDFNDPFIVIAGGSFNEALHINAGGSVLTITGGYDSGCHGPVAGSTTTISAANRSGSVLAVNGGIALSLNSLNLTGADTLGNGGGIDFDGTGTLDVAHVAIFGNHAGSGAGLYANGQSGGLSINLHAFTSIFNNQADHAGGGARISGSTRLFMLEGTTALISGNSVDPNDSNGAGGGMQIVGPARADIGSGIISGNSAKYGGGVSVNGNGDVSGILRFFTTKPGQPTRIEYNKASHTGGGIFLGADQGVTSNNRGIACGYGFSISSNSAVEGAALYLDTSSATIGFTGGAEAELSSAFLNSALPCESAEPAAALGALDCAVGVPCNNINDNRAEDSNGNPTDGSIVLIQTQASFKSERAELRRNLGSHIVRGFETLTNLPSSFSNCLLADNTVTSDFIRMEESGTLALSNCTVSGNAIGGSHVLSLTGDLTLTESLVWQSGTTILQQDSGRQRNVHNVLASDIFSLGGGNTVLALYPQFVAPNNGDYHLLSTSPALDFAPALVGTDLEGRTRTIDLPLPNRPGGGALDLGAYELQALPVFPPDETFDEVTVPALPLGWISTPTGGGADWFTTTIDALSSPNAAFVPDTTVVTDKRLTTPAFVPAANSQLRFRHKYDLDASSPLSGVTFDCVVLEISVAGADFQDIFAAGGRFVSGAYDHNVFSGSGNPLAGRSAWGGTSAGYQPVLINLPPGIGNSPIALRWRMGTDAFEAKVGYWLDDIHVSVPPSDRIFAACFAPTCPD